MDTTTIDALWRERRGITDSTRPDEADRTFDLWLNDFEI